MKHKATVLLGLLVLANAGLWAAYLHRTETPPVTSPVVATPPVAPPASPPVVAAPAPLMLSKIWAQLQCDDPVRFAANLRGAGAPEPTVRLLVSGQLRERYFARQRELFGASDPSPYGQSAAAAENREKLTALRALAREQQELLRSLFGNDESEPVARERLRRQYGALPEDKLDRLDAIHSDYDEMGAEIRRKAGGLLLTAEREALELLEQEKRKDIVAILSPAELELFDLQTSTAARALRNRLAGFAPSEQEFRTIFALQRAFDEKFSRRNGAAFDGGRIPDRAVAEQELDAKLHVALGEARFAEYRKQQDGGYRVATRIAERFGLPVQRAGEVYALAQETQARLQALRGDRALAPEAVLLALNTINRETHEKLVALLSPEGADAYKQTSGGAWLRTMDRVARPLAVAATAAPEVAGPTSVAEEKTSEIQPTPVAAPEHVAAPSTEAAVAGPNG